MKLPNAPLKEVIFEIFWASPQDGDTINDGFDLALGAFAIKMEEAELSKVIRKVPANTIVPPGVLTHQFWKGEQLWPVVQIGPGTMAVNDIGRNYEWEGKGGYFELIKLSLKNINESHRTELPVSKATLRYIDQVEIDRKVNARDFLRENFKIELNASFDFPGKEEKFNITQTFRLDDGSALVLVIEEIFDKGTDKKNLSWNTIIEKKFAGVDQNVIIEWADEAHNVASRTFRELLKPGFYDSFN